MFKNFWSHIAGIFTIKRLQVIQAQIEFAMSQQQCGTITLPYKNRLGRIADMLDTLLMQIAGNVYQRFQYIIYEPFFCYYGRILQQHFLKGLEMPWFHQ